MKTKEEIATYKKNWDEDNREEQKAYKKAWYLANREERQLENSTRMTIQGQRYRVGNPEHPYNAVYKAKGFKGVYEAMGLVESTASVIKKAVLALYDKHIQGAVYIITNPAWGGWVKVGMAVDAEDRLRGYQTSSPFRDYKLYYSYDTADRRKSEAEAHDLLELKYKRRNEWFLCTPEQAKEALHE
jgi:hypothetical protein